MKYQTADYIRSFVWALSIEAQNNDLGCALVQRLETPEEWEVHLYSKNEIYNSDFCFTLLVNAIMLLVPTLTCYKGKYDGGRLKGEKIYDSIVIW